MKKQPILKIITSLIFIPLITFFSLGLIAYLGKDNTTLMVLTFINVVLILSYVAILRKIKKQSQTKEKEKDIDRLMQANGYNKIYKNFFVNEKEKKIILNSKEYGFSEIKDCEIKVEDNVNMYAYKNIATSQNYCKKLYINIIIDNLSDPNVKLNFISNNRISISSNRYRKMYDEAEKVLSILKIIIARNNEKYIENGTITKIEHRYINEETTEEKLKKLAELYKLGAITEYEYSIKKQELLK